MSINEAINAVEARFCVEIARTTSQINECFRVRHQIYCTERGFEPDIGTLETDHYDARACHIALRRHSGEIVGTARLVRSAGLAGFPMQTVCSPGLMRGLPTATTAEISRFSISRMRRDMQSGTDGMLRLMLIKGVLEASIENGLTHWCAIMEPTLLRLLRMASIHFRNVGPLVEYHGMRQPAVAEIATMLDRGYSENPLIWNYVTDGGALLADRVPAMAA